MRLGHLKHEDHRDYADDLLKQMCIADGMCKVRAAWVRLTLKYFGEKHARRRTGPEDETICVP